MSKLVVKKSVIIINDYKLGDCLKLEDNFTIFDPIYHTYNYLGIYYDKENQRLFLPRGIDVWYVERLLNTEAVFDDTIDPYDEIGTVMLKYKPRDERQGGALEFMLGQSVQTRQNKYKPQLSVNLPTGAGKTYCAIASFSFLQERCAVITSSISWLEQWKKCILDYTNLEQKDIYLISGVGSIIRLLSKNEISQYKVFLVSLATLRSYGDKEGWEQVHELFKAMRIGVKFYDEAHLNFSAMCMIDYFSSTKKTYYLTASPARSNKDENRIFQLYFKNIPSIDLFDYDNDPHTNYVCIKYNSEPTPQQISKTRNKYGLDRNAYTNYIVKQPNYFKLLTILLKIALNQNGKTLIYIGTQQAIDTTYDWIINNYPELNGNVGVFTSKTQGNKMNELNKRIILSTVKSCGAAVDIKGLKLTILLAEPFKSEVQTIQTFGRTRDKDTLYIEIVDLAFRQITKFYYAKKPIIEKYALSMNEIKLDKYELESRYEAILDERKPFEIIPYAAITFSKFKSQPQEYIYFDDNNTRLISGIWFE